MNMRHLAALTLGLGFGLVLAAASGAEAMPMPAVGQPSGAPALTKVEYFCGVGFVPTYGGRCVATAARDEVEIFVDQPAEAVEHPVYRHHHRRHGVRERY